MGIYQRAVSSITDRFGFINGKLHLEENRVNLPNPFVHKALGKYQIQESGGLGTIMHLRSPSLTEKINVYPVVGWKKNQTGIGSRTQMGM